MPGLEGKNPWISIWWEPKQTVRSLVQVNPKLHMGWLCFFYGLPMALNFAQSYSFIEVLPIWAILFSAVIIAPFIGMVGLSVSAWFLQWTGRLIGGKGDFQNVRCSIAWSNVPNVFTIAMWGVLVGVFGTDTFRKDFVDATFNGYQSGILFLVFLIESIASIWGFVILLKTLSEVQGFSVWKALLNVAIPIAGLFAVLWIAAQVF